MRLDMERICQLAGVKNSSQKKFGFGVINENASRGTLLNESSNNLIDESEDELIEIDETMLVQELRRARRLMNESRKREQAKRQHLQEMQLKGIIDQEVKNVLKELQSGSSWIYGKKKPTRSRRGYTHQGTYLKGIGFK